MTELSIRTYADLRRDTLALAAKLPGPYACVIGVPRSGMLVALQLALHWNIPCYSLSEYLVGCTNPFSMRQQHTAGRPLLVDDSVGSGSAMLKARCQLDKVCRSYEAACLYIAKQTNVVDYWHSSLAHPRAFEWNLFHHQTVTQWCASDIDGVLCPDPPASIDEVVNEQSYIDWISNAPCIRPCSTQLHTLVTSRLEKYRPQTETWLRDNGYEYCHLFMCQDATAQERRSKNRHAAAKAQRYAENPKLLLFIESARYQAEQIAADTGRPVFCTDEGRLY